MVENLVRYLVFRNQVIKLERQRNDFWEDEFGGICAFWEDEFGGIYAFSEANSSIDLVDRCGVYPYSLPSSHPLTNGCAYHDFRYSSPVYQLFHTREEADKDLLRDIKLISDSKWYKILAWPFYYVSRLFGAKYWENTKTR